ncbi:MAG: serine hydrolase domain-containing protein [Vicinamibacterales bacterium]
MPTRASRRSPARLVLVVVLAVAAAGLVARPSAQAGPDALKRQVRTYLDAWRSEASFPGVSVGLVLADGRAIGVTSGLADRDAGTPLAVDDLMLAGSTGKTFFAAVAAALIEEGRLDLDAPIATYLGDRPWFDRLPNARAITVRHLMTHTSGLVRYEMNPAFTADLRAAPDKAWSPEEELAYLFGTPPPFAPGEGWDYSDTNYIVLGLILERVTGTALYDEVSRRFLRPLGLTRVVPSTSRRIPGLVPGYAGPRDPLGLPDRVLVDGTFVINPQFEWTGGGYATSARDLARWGHALYTGRAIPLPALRRMVDAAVPARLGPGTSYGLGVIVRSGTPVGTTWGHSGFFPGYLTELVHATASHVTVAVQVNTSAPRATGGRSPLRAAYDLLAIAAGPR